MDGHLGLRLLDRLPYRSMSIGLINPKKCGEVRDNGDRWHLVPTRSDALCEYDLPLWLCRTKLSNHFTQCGKRIIRQHNRNGDSFDSLDGLTVGSAWVRVAPKGGTPGIGKVHSCGGSTSTYFLQRIGRFRRGATLKGAYRSISRLTAPHILNL